MIFSSIKEINRYVKHLLLRKTEVRKTLILSEENLKKCTTFEEQKGTRYIGETFILASSSSAVFHLQNSVSDFFEFVLIRR